MNIKANNALIYFKVSANSNTTLNHILSYTPIQLHFLHIYNTLIQSIITQQKLKYIKHI